MKFFTAVAVLAAVASARDFELRKRQCAGIVGISAEVINDLAGTGATFCDLIVGTNVVQTVTATQTVSTAQVTATATVTDTVYVLKRQAQPTPLLPPNLVQFGLPLLQQACKCLGYGVPPVTATVSRVATATTTAYTTLVTVVNGAPPVSPPSPGGSPSVSNPPASYPPANGPGCVHSGSMSPSTVVTSENFETNSWLDTTNTYWSPASSANPVSLVQPGYNSLQAGEITIGSQNTYERYWLAVPGLVPGRQYFLTGQVQISQADCNLDIRVIHSSPLDVESIYNTAGDPTNTWVSFETSFLARGSTNSVRFRFVNSDGAACSVELDNLVLSFQNPTAYSIYTPATGGNLVQNPGFEAGIADYSFQYSDSNSGSSTVQVQNGVGRGGSAGLSIGIASSPFSNYDNAIVQFSQSGLPACKDGVYRVSLDFELVSFSGNSLSDCGITAHVYLDNGNTRQALAFQFTLDQINGAVGAYSTVSGILGIADTAQEVTLAVSLFCTNQATLSTVFDNISIVPLN